MISAARSKPRFRGPAATPRSQQFAAAVVIATIAATGIGGLIAGLAALTFFAVGAGAGYSLSGSV